MVGPVTADGKEVKFEEMFDNVLDTVPEDEGYTLLVDSYEATVATVGGNGHNEYCLYQKDDTYEIHYFLKYENEKEIHQAYKTNKQCCDELFDYIKKENIKDYMNKSYPGMTGGILVIKFKDGENLIRLSSDNVPYGKHQIFYDIRNILMKYVDKNNMIKK